MSQGYILLFRRHSLYLPLVTSTIEAISLVQFMMYGMSKQYRSIKDHT